jgi:hypothetical protein
MIADAYNSTSGAIDGVVKVIGYVFTISLFVGIFRFVKGKVKK